MVTTFARLGSLLGGGVHEHSFSDGLATDSATVTVTINDVPGSDDPDTGNNSASASFSVGVFSDQFEATNGD